MRLVVSFVDANVRNFNPRTHVGCDAIKFPSQLLSRSFQSTHPRGVRRSAFWQTLANVYFNPRTHVGCDDRNRIPRTRSPYFNPRTHVGCDTVTGYLEHVLPISIHAPTWGATPAVSLLKDSLIFQSTHPRGVRHPFVGVIRLLGLISIHAPTWGATQRSHSCACAA